MQILNIYYLSEILLLLIKTTKMYDYPSLPKRIFFVIASLFLILQSYKLCTITFSAIEIPLLWQIIGGFVFNLFVTGIFAFAVFSLPVERLLPESYYRISNPKNLNKFGKSIGIERFRKFLLATVWKDKDKQKGYFNGTAAGLDTFDVNTKKSDFGHLIPLILLTVISVVLCFYGNWVMASVTMLINVIFNFYPVVLQRMHRVRTARMRAILKRRREG